MAELHDTLESSTVSHFMTVNTRKIKILPLDADGDGGAGGGEGDAAVGESRTKTSTVDKSEKNVSAKMDAAFSELVGDLLKDDPLPFIKDA